MDHRPSEIRRPDKKVNGAKLTQRQKIAMTLIGSRLAMFPNGMRPADLSQERNDDELIRAASGKLSFGAHTMFVSLSARENLAIDRIPRRFELRVVRQFKNDPLYAVLAQVLFEFYVSIEVAPRNYYAFAGSIAASSPAPAILRMSSVIFIEQYFGPHMLQK
jgi:hypothetical protein